MGRHADFIIPGQTWAIVGESDSGHSALLRTMEGKDAERVSFKHHFRNLSNTTDFYYQQRFNSTDSDDAPTVRDHLAQLSGQTALPTSASNVREKQQEKGQPGSPTVAKPSRFWTMERAIDRLRLQPLLDEQLIKLSNGETKRLLIAAALVKNPKILLLDHPLTGLDVATRAAFNDLIKDITATGTIVVIASSPAEIPKAVTHVAVMKDGQIVHHGEKHLFDPQQFGLYHEVSIDDEGLKPLLSRHDQQTFDMVVGMKNVTIRYNDHLILDHINWEVRQGERWSLSGPNGAGKSTLLSLVNGDNPQAYANNIILFDKQRGSGESIWDIKRKTGFVSPELYQYFPTDSSCLQVIESGFYDTIGLFRAPDARKAAHCLQWMQFMNIGKYARVLLSRSPSAIQRLCLLARALVKNPPLLILDEPTQGLDSQQQQFFTMLIDRICRNSNVTLIYVSHYREHIPAAVTRHIMLEKGKVAQII